MLLFPNLGLKPMDQPKQRKDREEKSPIQRIRVDFIKRQLEDGIRCARIALDDGSIISAAEARKARKDFEKYFPMVSDHLTEDERAEVSEVLKRLDEILEKL